MRVRDAVCAALAGLLVLSGGSGVSASSAGRPAPPFDGPGWGARPVSAVLWRPGEAAILGGLPGDSRIAYHAGTGRVRFLAGSPARPLATSASLRPTALALGLATESELAAGTGPLMPEVAARAFIARVGPLFGLSGGVSRLRTEEVSTAEGGRSFARFQQQRDGVDILGGELIVQADATGDIVSASGEVLPDGDPVSTAPRLGSDRARAIATEAVARGARVPRSTLIAGGATLAIADERLLGGPPLPGPRLVWGVDVTQNGAAIAAASAPVSRTVYVDAANGAIALSIDRIQPALDRRICDFQNHRRKDFRCHGDYIRTEDDPPTGRDQVDDVYANMKRTYDFYKQQFDRDGLDGHGEPYVATVRYCSLVSCPFYNAFWEWGPQQTAFGDHWTTPDDVVAHEFTHGIQDSEDRLFYYYQSGAINESLADTFGEFVDLTDGFGDDRSSVRWRFGEQLPGGALRDMQDPTRYGDPDRIRSPRYWNSESDTGGVHYNSGVGNKAVALITDGGTFNGYHIRGLGLTKAPLIYYELMTHLLTSAADYNDMYDALPQACLDLVGTHGIGYDDCEQVHEAVAATEMDLQPAGRAAVKAPVCGEGRVPDTTFFDDFEDPGSGDWESTILHGPRDTWYYPPNPNNDPKWDGTWASSGHLNLFGDDPRIATDVVMAMTRSVDVPAHAFLRFERGFRFDFDSQGRHDGGIVEYKIDGGTWRNARDLFVQGRYNGKIKKGHGNPLGGHTAFSASSYGWGSSRLDLSTLAGSSVRFRFRTGTDSSGASYGWYIDDLRIYQCDVDDQAPTLGVTIAGGADTTDKAQVNVAIDATDVGSRVTRLRISDSPALQGGLLRYAMEMPFQDSLKWPLTDPDFGGDSAQGVHRVYAQVRDAAGNWSDVESDDIVYDTTGGLAGMPEGVVIPPH